jgi:hypothetical protein
LTGYLYIGSSLGLLINDWGLILYQVSLSALEFVMKNAPGYLRIFGFYAIMIGIINSLIGNLEVGIILISFGLFLLYLSAIKEVHRYIYNIFLSIFKKMKYIIQNFKYIIRKYRYITLKYLLTVTGIYFILYGLVKYNYGIKFGLSADSFLGGMLIVVGLLINYIIWHSKINKLIVDAFKGIVILIVEIIQEIIQSIYQSIISLLEFIIEIWKNKVNFIRGILSLGGVILIYLGFIRFLIGMSSDRPNEPILAILMLVSGALMEYIVWFNTVNLIIFELLKSIIELPKSIIESIWNIITTSFTWIRTNIVKGFKIMLTFLGFGSIIAGTILSSRLLIQGFLMIIFGIGIIYLIWRVQINLFVVRVFQKAFDIILAIKNAFKRFIQQFYGQIMLIAKKVIENSIPTLAGVLSILLLSYGVILIISGLFFNGSGDWTRGLLDFIPFLEPLTMVIQSGYYEETGRTLLGFFPEQIGWAGEITLGLGLNIVGIVLLYNVVKKNITINLDSLRSKASPIIFEDMTSKKGSVND